MSTTTGFTSRDLELLPDPIDGTRYEIIDGDLLVSKQPHLEHQSVNTALASALHVWSRRTGRGRAFVAPGMILADEQDVVPDVVWASHDRMAQIYEPDGKLHGAPELTVEILSPGSTNEGRERELKLKLYSRISVREYWIADWRARTVEFYRQARGGLRLNATLSDGDTLTSALLPGFALLLDELWESDGTT